MRGKKEASSIRQILSFPLFPRRANERASEEEFDWLLVHSYRRNAGTVRVRLERRRTETMWMNKQWTNRRALNSHTAAKKDRRGRSSWPPTREEEMRLVKVELEWDERSRTSSLLNWTVMIKRRARRRDRETTIDACWSFSVRFNCSLPFLNGRNGFDVKETGTLSNVWEERWEGRSPLSKTFVPTGLEVWEPVLKRGPFDGATTAVAEEFCPWVCCIEKTERSDRESFLTMFNS